MRYTITLDVGGEDLAWPHEDIARVLDTVASQLRDTREDGKGRAGTLAWEWSIDRQEHAVIDAPPAYRVPTVGDLLARKRARG